MLKVRIGPGDRDFDSPIGRIFQAAIGHHIAARNAVTKGQFGAAHWENVRRDVEHARARYLLLDLRRLEVGRPDVLREFVKRFKRARFVANFFSLRFELKMASMLVLKRIDFTRPDPPDFLIAVNGAQALIECGSVRMARPKSGDLSYKVLQEISEKSRKAYAAPTVALAIDATNLFFHGWVPAGSAGFELPAAVHHQLLAELKARIGAQLGAGSLGSVLVYVTQYDIDRRRLQSDYVRVDSSVAAPALISTLDAIAPFGKLYIRRAASTIEG